MADKTVFELGIISLVYFATPSVAFYTCLCEYSALCSFGLFIVAYNRLVLLPKNKIV